MKHSELVYVKKVPGKGRGVFARVAIKKGEVVELAPVALVPFNLLQGAPDNPQLVRLFFEWDNKHLAVSLGYGSIYNHSYNPNAIYEHGTMVMTYRALRNIAAHEEITVNYNGNPRSKASVGFDVKE